MPRPSWDERFAVLERVMAARRCRRGSRCRPAPGPRRPRRSAGSPPSTGDSASPSSPPTWAGAGATSPSSSRPSTASAPKEMARVLRFERSKRLLIGPDARHAGRDRRRVRVRRSGPHGPRLADARRLQPDAVDGRRTAPNRPSRRRRRRRMIGP